jgi:cellulose 1,4-beta-cellobiosidase
MRHLRPSVIVAGSVGILLGSLGPRGPSAGGRTAHAELSAGAAGANPFANARLYVNAEFAQLVDAAAAHAPAEAARIRKLASYPTAVWLDSIARVSTVSQHLAAAARQQAAAGKPVVPVFVIYDLPVRDCAAKASSGELGPHDEQRYQREYIDGIAAQLRAHATQKVAVIVEPDSLANLATNLGLERCAAAAPLYRRNVAYAISKLSQPNVAVYLDAAHGGWLGWKRNLDKMVEIWGEVLTAAGGAQRIRGFAVNVSNYNPTRVANGRRGGPNEPGPDETAYVADLALALDRVGIAGKGFIIDTSRNGRVGIRSSSANWCNIHGAGLGERPGVAPVPSFDANLWIKIPGESDGTSDPAAPRFDANCASKDAAPQAPEAGQPFVPYLVDLVKNANPPL